MFDSISTFDSSEIAGELNLDGVLTARSVAIDLPASGVTEIGSLVTIYPGLREELEENPNFLAELTPEEIEALAFDFYVTASATPLTSAQYVDYQRGEAARLRTAILADIDAPNQLVSIAGDGEAFADLFLAALADVGLLRDEDAPPTATPTSDNVNLFFSALGGLLGGDAGSGIIDDAAVELATAETTLVTLVERLRGYFGHTADVFGGGALPTFDQYDLAAPNPTSFIAFELRAVVPDDDRGEVADTILFNLDDFGQQVGDSITITGPTGVDVDNFVPFETPLPYSVTATYDSESSDAANEIRILVPLDDTIDERSFQLGGITLGGRNITLPPGRPNFVGEFDLVDDEGYQLQVTAGVDANTRVASYLLRAIDPRDGLPPVDPVGRIVVAGRITNGSFLCQRQRHQCRRTNRRPANRRRDRDDRARDHRRRGTGRQRNDDGDAGCLSTDQQFGRHADRRRSLPTGLVRRRRCGRQRRRGVLVVGFRRRWHSVPQRLVPHRGDFVRLRSRRRRSATVPGPIDRRGRQRRTGRRRHPRSAIGARHQPRWFRTADGRRRSAAAPRDAATRNGGGPVVRRIGVGHPVADQRDAAQPVRASDPSAGRRALRDDPGNLRCKHWCAGDGGRARRQRLRFRGCRAERALPHRRGPTEAIVGWWRPTDSPIYEMVFDAAGQLWASTGGEGLLQLDPATGAVLDRVGAGISLGLAAIPGQNAIYVATTGGVARLDTATRRLTPFSNVRVDAMAVDADGTLYGTAWPTGGEVLRFDFRGRAEVIGSVSGGAESLAIGAAGSLVDGALIVGHQNGGRISIIDPQSLRQTVIASGGTGRVEGIESLPDGRFLVTQGDQVDIFFTVAAPRVVDTIIRQNNRAALVFDVGLNAADPARTSSATRGANYTIVNKDTGQSVGIGAVQYDAATRTSELLFESLAPAEYELRVAPSIESEQGIPIGGNGFTTTFRVFEDVSISTSVAYSATRIHRGDGTLLFDVTVTNTADFDIAGPINVIFDQFGDASVVFFGNDGLPADANGFQVLADGTVLAAGTSSLPQTVVIANPNLLDLDFDPRVLATLPPNLLPTFDSTPQLSAAASAEYEYAATASDPDGNRVTYVLTDAPEGATVDPNSGAVSWMPTRGAAPRTTFELRAYDARGAFERQVWTVDVTGANRPPIIAPVEDLLATEGDLIEIPISGFDPDGDDLFYFADRLPPGAVFDSVGQTLRWRPGGDDAGVYESVRLIASDGFVETSVTFDIVIANNNVAPTLAPVADRTINEGDAITFRLFGNDEDGDTLRYLSPNLPPGAFVDPNTGLFEWTPGFDQHGVFDLTFFADDGESLTRVTSTITVNNINGPVAFSAIGEFTIFEGQSLDVRVAAFDPEFPVAPTNSLTTTDDFFIDFAGLLPDLTYTHGTLPDGATFDVDRQVFTWTPAFDATGGLETRRFEIDFTATDDGDGTGTPTSDTVTLAINVRNANFRPEITTIDNRIVPVGTTLDIPIVAVDPDGTPIELDVTIGQSTQLPSWATLTDNGDGTGTLSVSPVAGDRDDYLVTVRARETTGEAPLGESVQFILQVTSANEPPRLTPFFDSVALVGQPFTLVINTTDADEDPLTFTTSTLPTGASLVTEDFYGRATFTWTPTAADIGQTTITFNVADSGNDGAGGVLSDSREITLTVRENNTRPNLEPIGAQTIAEGQTLHINAAATDVDGDDVFFTAALVRGTTTTRLPTGVTFDGDSGALTWTPTLSQAGTYRLRITASDGAGSRSEDVLVTVTNTNQPPQINPLPRLFAREGDQTVFSINAGDADGEPLIYSYDGDAIDGFTFDPLTRVVIWDVDFESAGEYSLPFTVTDPSGGSDTIDVDVQVLATNRAPSITAPQLRNAQIGEAFTLVIPTSDPDGDDVTLAAIDLPEGATLNVVDGVSQIDWTPQSFQAGTYTVRLTADDGATQIRRALTLVASLEPVSPDLQILLTPSFPASPGQTVTIEPIADSDVAIGEATLSVDGTPIVLDSVGRGSFIADAPGRYEVTATVTDIEGRTTTTTRPIFVRDLADRAAPRIEITEFAPPIVTGTRDMMFDIFDDGLAEYKVELVPIGGGDPILLREGTTSIVRLVTIDPSLYENGFYVARVTASDFGGLTSVATFDLEINSTDKSGAVNETATDMTFTLAGIDVDVTRFYSSIRSLDAASDFGAAWSWPLVDPQIAIGGDTTDDVFAGLADGTRLYLTLPTGERVGYTFAPTELTDAGSGVTTYQPAWTADDGVTWTLTSPATAPLRRAGGAYFVVGTGLSYSPNVASDVSFTLVSPAGQRHELTEKSPDTFLLSRIVAADDRTSLRFTSSGIVASDGSNLTIVRNSHGQISELVGSDGQHTVYRYQSDGQMVSAIDAVSGDRTFYGYDDEGRLTVIAPTASDGIHFPYNGDGTPLPTSPVAPHLGGTRSIIAGDLTGATIEGDVDRYAFTVTEGELRSSPTGRITVGIMTTSSDFDPNPATIEGLSSGFESTITGRSITHVSIVTSGTYVLSLSGGTGEYSASIFLVGDADNDGDVDANDSSIGGDFDRDGDVDEVDTAGLNAMFGFVANTAPSQRTNSPDIVSRGRNAAVTDLNEWLVDAEMDPLTFVSVVGLDAEVRPLGSGLYRIVPTGDASAIDVSASDGLLNSSSIRIGVRDEVPSLMALETVSPEIVLDLGASSVLDLIARNAVGEEVSLSFDELTFRSLDPNVAVVTDGGIILAGNEGTTAVLVSAYGYTTAIAVTVGQRDGDTRQFYPESYAMAVGDTRQSIIRVRRDEAVANVSAAADGAIYVSSDNTVATVSAEGLITATSAGRVDITMIQGGYRSVGTFVIEQQPASQTKTVGTSGGLIANASILVGISPGSVARDVAVSVQSVTEADAPYDLPPEFSFVAGVNIDSGEDVIEGEVSVRLAAPAGMSTGDSVFAFRPVDVREPDGSTSSIWAIFDTLTVDAAGTLSTNSPPYRSLGPSQGLFSVTPRLSGLMMLMAPPSVGTISLITGIMDAENSLRSVQTGSDGHKYIVLSSPLADFNIPAPASVETRVTVRSVNAEGQVNTIDYAVDTSSGPVNMGVVVPPRPVPIGREVAPEIQTVRIDVVGGNPELVITGRDFLNPIEGQVGSGRDELSVRLVVGGQDIPDDDGTEIVGGLDLLVRGSELTLTGDEIRFPVPQGIAVGDAIIRIERPAKIFERSSGRLIDGVLTSNPAKLVSVSQYLFAAQAGGTAIDVIRTDNTIDTEIGPKKQPIRIGQIEVENLINGRSENLGTYDITMSAEGQRAYVLLPTTSRVGVMDPIALRMIDIIPGNMTPTPAGGMVDLVDGINLPVGSVPHRAEYDGKRDRLYVTDRHHPTLYVVDTDPTSSTFHQLIATVTIPNPLYASRGLTDVLLSSDASRLYVGVPGANGGDGILYVFTVNDSDALLPLEPAEAATQIVDVGPLPYRMTPTDDPNVILVVDRQSDPQGVGVIRFDPMTGSHEPPAFINLNAFTGDQERRPIGITNPSDIVYIPADRFKDETSTIPEIRDGHPPYVLISSFNKFNVSDTKHNPNLGPFVLQDGRFATESGTLIPTIVAAGSNVGVIRDPLAALDGDRVIPATVTAPIPVGFSDSLEVSSDGLQLFLGLQARDQVAGYDLVQLLLNTEITTQQYIEDGSPGLGSLIQRLPVNTVHPSINSNADLRFHELPPRPLDDDGNPIGPANPLVFGVPPVGPLGETPNLFAPIEVGRLGRGLVATVLQKADITPLTYNHQPTLCDINTLSCALKVDAGLSAQADAHDGSLIETHALATFKSGDQDFGLTLRYDSARADVRPLLHVSYPGVPRGGDMLVTRLSAQLGEETFKADGFTDTPERLSELNLKGGEHFFQRPTAENDGFALQIDLSDGESGVYDLIANLGLYRRKGEKFEGVSSDMVSKVAVVNSRKSAFGAGWDLEGYRRIYEAGGSVLMADGNGSETIWELSTDADGKPTYSSTSDTGTLKLEGGNFVYTSRRGVVDRYDVKDRLESRTDRNGNMLSFEHSGDRLVAVIDTYDQRTTFTYAGDRIIRITDPAGRTTGLSYSGDTLVQITDPDSTLRGFQYDQRRLMQGQTVKRGFTEAYQFDDFGLVESGTRVDGAQFQLTPSRAIGIRKIGDSTNPDKPAKLETFEGGIGAVADARYIGFDRRVSELEVDASGRLSKSTNAARTVSLERNEFGQIRTTDDGLGNLTRLTYNDSGDLIGESYEPADGQGWTRSYAYNLFGDLIETVDRGGRRTVITVDGAGNRTETRVLPAGLAPVVTTFVFDPYGSVVRSTDPAGRETTMTRDEFGRVTSHTLPGGDTVTTSYDPAGNVVQTSRGGIVVATAQYDLLNRATSQSAGSILTSTTSYDEAGNVIAEVNSFGGTTFHAHDPLNRVIETIDPNGGVSSQRYDLRNNVIQTQTVASGTSAFTYDEKDQLIAHTDGLGRTRRLFYDAQGRPTSEIDSLGRTSSRTYDSRSNQTSTKTPGRPATTYTYDARDNRTSVTDSAGRVTRTDYDGLDRPIKITDADGGEISFTYDVIGNRLTATDPLGRTITTTYDELDRPVTVTNPLGESVSTTYNAVGRIIATIDPLGNELQYEYDAAGRITRITESTGAVTSTQYNEGGRVEVITLPGGDTERREHDAAGNVIAISDANGLTITSEYDNAGRLIATTNPDGGQESYTYDVLSRPLTTTDSLGRTTATAYDNADRIVSATDAAGGMTKLVYDQANNLVSQTDAIGNTTRWTHDLVGNIVTQTDALGGLQRFSYDSLDRGVSTTDELGRTGTRTYDAAGQLISITDPLGQVTTFAYDSAGRQVSATDPLGRVSRSVFDAAGRLVASIDAASQVTEIEYDAAGRQTRVTAADGGQVEMIYDAQGRLVSQTDPIGRITTYQYDAGGRVTEITDPTGGATRIAYNSLNLPITMTAADGSVSRTEYDAAGQTTASIDPLGRRTETLYDNRGNVIRQTFLGNASTTFAYDAVSRNISRVDSSGTQYETEFDALGNVLAVTDGRGGVTSFVYDAGSQLIRQVDPLGNTTTVTYDAVGQQISRTDARGNETKLTYDAGGQLIRQTHADDSFTVTAYNAVGNAISETNELGNTWQTQYDAVGRITSVSDPLGNQAVTTWNAAGERIAEQDSLGNVFEFFYDALGNQIEQKFPVPFDGGSAASIFITRDAVGRPLTITDREGNTETNIYDAAGQLVSFTDSLGRVTTYEYDGRGNETTITPPIGGSLEYDYDSLGRRVRTTEPGGGITTYRYDNAGNPVEVTDQLGRSTFYSYDLAGRQISVLTADGSTTSTAYDEIGNPIRQVDGAGRVIALAYDSRNRLTTETRDNGAVTTNTYDSAGNLISVTDAVGNVTTYTYDANNRDIAVTDATGSTTTLAYDANDRLIARTEPRGRATTFTLDNWGRVVAEETTDDNGDVTVVTSRYNANDQLVFTGDGDSSLTFSYFDDGRVASQTQAYDGVLGVFVGSVDYSYDAGGRPSGHQVRVANTIDHRVGRTYNQRGDTNRLTFEVPSLVELLVDYSWDATHRLIALNRSGSVTAPNGGSGSSSTAASIQSDWVNDTLGRPIVISHEISSIGIARNAEHRLVYDSTGRVIRSTDDFGTHDYAYDDSGQIAGVMHSSDVLADQQYVFDGAGNPSTFDGAEITVGLGNRLTRDGRFTYSYDDAGNLIAKESIVDTSRVDYGWDGRDRLIEVRETDALGEVTKVVRYAYDPANRRIAEVVTLSGGATTESARYFLYDREDIAVTLSDVDGPSGEAPALVGERFFHGVGTDEVLARHDATAAQSTDAEVLSAIDWYLGDHLGSVRDVVDATGQTRDTILYDAYGNFLSRDDTTVALPFGFTGRELDAATGLYFFRARYYDPSIGRFLSPDPSGLASGDVNLYRYVGNNPLSLVDPSGLVAEQPSNLQRNVESVAQGIESFGQYIGLSPTLFRSEANPIGVGSYLNGKLSNLFEGSPTAVALGSLVEGLVDIPGHLANLTRFGGGLFEGFLNIAFDVKNTFVDINNHANGIYSTESNLFKALDSVNSFGDVLSLGVSLFIAPAFSFIDFGAKVFSGDPFQAGKATATTLPEITAVRGLRPTRAAKSFLSQPFGNGISGLLDLPVTFGGIAQVGYGVFGASADCSPSARRDQRLQTTFRQPSRLPRCAA